ncbi:MAG: ATP-binding protein [Prevotellaceae bacterium]|nr:ATP-binding protein [Candidatus Faecinaster equi]
MVTRELQAELLRLSEKWQVISVTGPRQSGKTTLCKMTFPNYAYVNFEHIPTRDKVLQDIDAFLDQYPNGLIIDEAQHIPEIFSYIQVRVDVNKDLRYILSGSSDFLMMQGITQSLAGRVAVRRLLPLSLNEIKAINPFSTDELLVRGFYPGVWGDGREPQDVYESYYETYLDRDVRQIINVQNITAFRRFVVLLASRIGSEFNAQDLSKSVGVSNQTISNWMAILETSYTAFRLQPFYKNIGKRLVKTPKVYFYDTGLICWLLGITCAQDLEKHPMRGALFENMVVVEKLKQCYNAGKTSNLFFYRDQSQNEVDIIQESGLNIEAYEVKSAKNFNSDFLSTIHYLEKIMPTTIAHSAVIYDGTEEIRTEIDGVFNYRTLFS